MSVSLKNLPRMINISPKKDTFNLNLINRNKSIEKPKKYLSLKNLFYHQEKLNKNKNIIKTDLPILNFISFPSENKSSIKTTLTDTVPDIYNYKSYMINKFDENLNLSLSFISKFDLENDEKSLEESFNSSDNEHECEEQIEIRSSTKLFGDNNEEDEKRLDKEWNDIQEILLNK